MTARQRFGISSRAMTLFGVGVAVVLGASRVQGQTVSSDTQYQYQNSNGLFSIGFTPAFPAAGDISGELNFGGTTAYTVTDDLANANANDLTFTDAGLVTIASSSPTNVLTLTANAAGVAPLIFVGTGDSALINVILGGTAGFTKTGTGTLILGAANTYSGTTTLSAGTINTAQTSGALLTSGGGTIALNGGTLSVTPATVSATTDVALTTPGFTVGGGSTLVLNKGGNESLTLTAGNGTTGLTFTPGGALVLQPTAIANLGATAAAGGERLLVSGTAPLNSGNANLVGVSIVAQEGTGSGTNPASTADFLRYDVNNGFVSDAANYTSFTTGNITTTANEILNINTGAPNPILLTGTNTIAGLRVTNATLSIGNSSSKTLTIGNNANLVAPIILNGATVAFGSSGGSILSFGTSLGSVYVSSAGGTIGSTGNGGHVSGSGGLLAYGPGTLTLLSPNNYVGPTFLASGTVNLGITQNGTTSGPLGTGVGANSLITFTGGTLQYSAVNVFDYSPRFNTAGNNLISIDTNGQTVTYGTAIQGTGTSLTKLGAGTLNSTAANTYTGGTTLNAGTLTLSGANTFGTGGVTVNGGTAVLNNSNTYSGGTLVTGGSLTLSGANAFDIGGITVTGGALAISGANTGTGATTLTGGTLTVTNVAGSSATGSGNVAVNGGTLIGSGSIGGTVTVGGGTVSPGAAGVTLTLGALTYNSGTLNFSLNGSTSPVSSSQLATTNTAFTAAPTITFNGTGTVTNGEQFTLLTSANPITGTSFLASIAPTVIGRLTLTPTLSGNNTIVVNASGAAANLVWAGGVAGLSTSTAPQGNGSTWNNTQNAAASNWNNGGKYDYFYDADNVTFNDTGSASLAVNLTTNNAPGSVTVNSTRNYVLSGVGSLTGSGSLVNSGSGNLTLSTVNTYTGGTTISAGTITLGVANALPTAGALTVQGTGTLSLAGLNQTLATLADGGVATGTITSSSGTPILTVNNAVDNSFSGIVSGLIGLAKTSTGTLTLSGPNTYTGATTVSNGTVIAATDSALGSGTGAGLLLNPASGTAVVDFTSATPSIGSLASSGAGTSTVVLGNTAAPNATALTVGGAGATTVFGGVISDASTAANGSLIVSGGQLTLNGADTFTGTTTVTGGTLVLGNSLALQNSTLNGNGGAISFGTLTAATVGGLSGSQNLVLTNTTPAPVALTVGNGNVTSTYTGILSGTGSLIKLGTGTLTIGSGTTGGATYSGATLVDIGTLQLGGVTNINAGANTITVAGNISAAAAGAANLILADTAQITTTGILTLSSLPNVNNNGAVTIVIGGNAQATVGSFRFGDGNSRVNGATSLTISGSGALTVNGTFDLNDSVNTATDNPVVNLNGGTLAVKSFIATQSGTALKQTLNFNGANVKSLGSDTSATVFFLPGKAGLTANVQANGALINTNGFNDTIGQVLAHGTNGASGTDGGLTISDSVGTGTLTLTAANTYTGATTISPGATLQLGNGASGNDGTVTVSSGLINNGALIYNRFGAPTSAIAISGGGSVTVNGLGSQTLTGASTYTGTTTVNGSLFVNGSIGSTGTPSGAVSVPVGGTLGGTGILTATSASVAGTLAPGGTAGAITGTLTLNTTNGLTISGTLTIGLNSTGGVSSGTLLNTGALTLSGATLSFNGGADGTTTYDLVNYTGTLGGDGAFANVSVPTGYSINYRGTTFSSTDIELDAVPEPSTLVILLGVAAATQLRRFKRLMVRA